MNPKIQQIVSRYAPTVNKKVIQPVRSLYDNFKVGAGEIGNMAGKAILNATMPNIANAPGVSPTPPPTNVRYEAPVSPVNNVINNVKKGARYVGEAVKDFVTPKIANAVGGEYSPLVEYFNGKLISQNYTRLPADDTKDTTGPYLQETFGGPTSAERGSFIDKSGKETIQPDNSYFHGKTPSGVKFQAFIVKNSTGNSVLIQPVMNSKMAKKTVHKDGSYTLAPNPDQPGLTPAQFEDAKNWIIQNKLKPGKGTSQTLYSGSEAFNNISFVNKPGGHGIAPDDPDEVAPDPNSYGDIGPYTSPGEQITPPPPDSTYHDATTPPAEQTSAEQTSASPGDHANKRQLPSYRYFNGKLVSMNENHLPNIKEEDYIADGSKPFVSEFVSRWLPSPDSYISGQTPSGLKFSAELDTGSWADSTPDNPHLFVYKDNGVTYHRDPNSPSGWRSDGQYKFGSKEAQPFTREELEEIRLWIIQNANKSKDARLTSANVTEDTEIN